MSMLNRQAKGNDLGEVIASTREYEAAQKTVSKLIAGEVPARDIAIVGEGVRTVERVTGKLGYAAAARSGAINGVLIGLVLSAIMLFGNPEAPISLFLGFILVGVALGMIMSLITYAIVRRRRDFASVSQMIADHYEVRVQAGSLTKARQVMGSERTTPTRPTVDLSEPPRYGERITPGSSGSAGAAGSAGAGGAAGHGSAPHTAAAPPPPPPLPAAPAAPAVPAVPTGADTDGASAGTSAAADAGSAPVGSPAGVGADGVSVGSPAAAGVDVTSDADGVDTASAGAPEATGAAAVTSDAGGAASDNGSTSSEGGSANASTGPEGGSERDGQGDANGDGQEPSGR